jgi:hypothetical protein
MKHLMVDIESMGNYNDGAIASIAAKFFDLDDTDSGKEFSINISLDSALSYGLTVNESCLHWWFTQSTEAREEIMKPPLVSLDKALQNFAFFIDTNRRNKFNIWSHSTFDMTLLHNAYNATGISIPWHYRSTRDIRTLHYICRGITLDTFEFEGVPHVALDDVRNQTKYVANMLVALENLKKGA